MALTMLDYHPLRQIKKAPLSGDIFCAGVGMNIFDAS
jgi:hypothetical protein